LTCDIRVLTTEIPLKLQGIPGDQGTWSGITPLLCVPRQMYARIIREASKGWLGIGEDYLEVVKGGNLEIIKGGQCKVIKGKFITCTIR